MYKKKNDKSDESTKSNTEINAENYKNGDVLNENKSLKYKESKGNAEKYNGKGGHNGQIHAHGGKNKEMAYKKGDKHKKFKTKKVINYNYDYNINR